MKADSLPEEPNNPQNQKSGEFNPPPESESSEHQSTCDTSAFPVSPSGNTGELLVVQDASTREKVPIIEYQSSNSQEENSSDELEAKSQSTASPPKTPNGEKVPIIEYESSMSEEENSSDELETSSESKASPSSKPDEKPSSSTLQDLEVQESSPDDSRKDTFTPTETSSSQEISPLTFHPSPSKKKMRIFVTGASGCIGHYIVETLIQETEHELFLLVRNPGKLKFDYEARPGITLVEGDMRNIKRFGNLLKTVDCAVLAATAWGGQEAIDVNVFKTLELLNLLDSKVCQQIIYFSTASVLDRNNQLLKAAGNMGTDYIRSKYDFLRQVTRVPISKRITALFPTLVLGGDDRHPYSHISGGLPDLMKETELIHLFNKPLLKAKPIDLIRFFKADASFHFIHAQDIAQVVHSLIENPPGKDDPRWLVLGNEPITLNQAVEEACAYLNKPITYQWNLSPWLTNFFISLFRIKMSAWDRFSLEYRHFTYENPVNPATFGRSVYCPTFIDVLKLSGISRRS